MEENKDGQTTAPTPTPTPTNTDTVPQVDLVDAEPIVAAIEGTPAPTAVAAPQKRSKWKLTVLAVALVAVALLAVLFRLEKEGRVNTNLFTSYLAAQEANRPVAVVNGVSLKAADLRTGVDQLIQAATAQGLDPADPEVQAEIQTQALEMLVNTELLKQSAAKVGITISSEQIDARIAEIETAAGGAEALAARLAEFDIDQTKLVADVTAELTIQTLLTDEVFAGADVAVSEIEVNEVYNNAVAQAGDQTLPSLEDVRVQIEQQIVQSKEQAALDAYLQALRADADIQLN